MPRGKKPKPKLEVTSEALNALKCRVPRRVISNDELTSIIETTRRLFGGASTRIEEFVRNRPHCCAKPALIALGVSSVLTGPTVV